MCVLFPNVTAENINSRPFLKLKYYYADCDGQLADADMIFKVWTFTRGGKNTKSTVPGHVGIIKMLF